MTTSTGTATVRRVRPADTARMRALRIEMLADAPLAFLETLAQAAARSHAEYGARIAEVSFGDEVAQFVAVAPDGRFVGHAGGVIAPDDRSLTVVFAVLRQPGLARQRPPRRAHRGGRHLVPPSRPARPDARGRRRQRPGRARLRAARLRRHRGAGPAPDGADDDRATDAPPGVNRLAPARGGPPREARPSVARSARGRNAGRLRPPPSGAARRRREAVVPAAAKTAGLRAQAQPSGARRRSSERSEDQLTQMCRRDWTMRNRLAT